MVFFGLLPGLEHKKRTESAPEQNAHVEIIRKTIVNNKRRSAYHLVYFEFPDGSEKAFNIKSEIYYTLQECETGMLTYKELENIEDRGALSDFFAPNHYYRRFIFFKKDS